MTTVTYLGMMMLPRDRLAGAHRAPTISGPPPNGSRPHHHDVIVVEADEQATTRMKMVIGSRPLRRGLMETDRIHPASDRIWPPSSGSGSAPSHLVETHGVDEAACDIG
jgi:hypothetical protein